MEQIESSISLDMIWLSRYEVQIITMSCSMKDEVGVGRLVEKMWGKKYRMSWLLVRK